MDKQNVDTPYMYAHSKQWNIVQPWKGKEIPPFVTTEWYTKWNKPTTGQVPWDSTYIKPTEEENRITDARGSGRRQGGITQRAQSFHCARWISPRDLLFSMVHIGNYIVLHTFKCAKFVSDEEVNLLVPFSSTRCFSHTLCNFHNNSLRWHCTNNWL